MIQFAAATCSWFTRGTILPLERITRGFPLYRQVACGAAAAVAAVYQAPVAGVFFASEIVLGNAEPAEYPLLLVAALAGWLVSGLVLERGPLFAAPAARVIALVLILRLSATVLCVGVGTIGGVFTPTLFAGAAAGLLFAHAVHAADPLLFILIGLGALLSAVTHAPIMAGFMTVELTGKWELLPATLLCNLIAWQIASRLAPGSLYGIATTTPGDRVSSYK
jgi:H+/Cl- antiporter ClcA